ncbi:hypothetical protein GA0070624_4416 [Micromonospora rhizosphaerae]|uniref:Uncharacterized protein n=1 Tax=Micromonospora rhizosphaerae TaxID=568872 RepID=A0A1C6SSN7_9ACTN|nr:hypothetical protein GA0070624_4416 [Micromonospora rhizosphaerae]
MEGFFGDNRPAGRRDRNLIPLGIVVTATAVVASQPTAGPGEDPESDRI